MDGDVPPTEPNISGRALSFLSLAIALSGLGYAALLRLSWGFSLDSVAEDRPTIAMLSVFGGLFVIYWIALWAVVRLPASRLLVVGIFASSCLFRGIMLPSIPMHEIDIYRYIWDGAVFAEGISPYRYSPDQVRDAVDAGGVDNDQALQSLVELQARSGSLNHSLDQIHFGQYPSPYPIVSQAVFALAAKVTPAASSSHTRLVIMKLQLVLFDLASLAAVMLLVREIGLHPGWSLAYGWCPLMMKEIANGGHLDSIAIFFTTLSILMLVKCVQASPHRKLSVVWAGAVLAVGIGAKLYPVILLPLFSAVWLRRLGWQEAVLGVATVGLLSAALLYPLLGPSEAQAVAASGSIEAEPPVGAGQLSLPPPSPALQVEADDGIEAFLNQWEMNDLIFMVVLENLRQQEEIEPEKKPWFVVTTDDWSRSIVTRWSVFKSSLLRPGEDATQDEPLSPTQLKRSSFSLARVITGGSFGIFACLLAWFTTGKNDPAAWCRAAMLTLAWFWLTCPTQNPWYWCWVLPLLPFARYRTWFVVAAMTMLYYLRFWLMAHYESPSVLGTPYDGAYFFYYVIAWIEFFPVLIALMFESGLAQFRGKNKKTASVVADNR